MGRLSETVRAPGGRFVHEALIAAAVAATLALVLPLQVFLGNASLYPFGIGRLLVELGVVFLALSLTLFSQLQFINSAGQSNNFCCNRQYK